MHTPSSATISNPATATASGVTLSFGNTVCSETVTTILSTTINGTPATVKCVRQLSLPGQHAPPAAVITGADGLELQESPNAIVGDVYFANPATIGLSNPLLVERGNIWYPSPSCPGTKPTIVNLTIESPDEYAYLCAASSASDGWSDRFAVPVVSALPATAPPPKRVGTCTVFFPGRYTTVPDLDNTHDAYFKSGLYYFDDLGEIPVKDTMVTGGRPGDSPAASASEELWNPLCASAATGSEVNDSGTGVTIVLGGSSRIKFGDKGGMELYAPTNGYSVVAYATDTNGYRASSGGTPSDPLIDQSADHSQLRIHGGVWAPTGHVELGRQSEAAYTRDNVAAIGGQLFGGIVVKNLTFGNRIPTGGDNIQADAPAVEYRVLVVSTANGVSVRVTADIRPSGNELAVQSWQTTDDASIAPGSPPILVTQPVLASGSDSGTLDDGVTKSPTPTFTGSAAPGTTVKLYDGSTLIGSAGATNGTYTITSSELTDGYHTLVAVAFDANGDSTQSNPATFRLDRTAPVVAATDVAVAPTFDNTLTGGWIREGGQYFVYATATDAVAVATMTADASALTAGQTAVVLEPGSYSLNGVSYDFRSAALTTRSVLPAGPKQIVASALDTAGNAGSSPTVTVNVDNSAPTGAITAPADGATVAVMQTVTSSSADAASGVHSAVFEYRVGGSAGEWTTIGTDVTSPYSVTWNTANLTGATYDLRVVTSDNAGNTAASAALNVTMRPPAAPSAPVLAAASDAGIQGDNITSDSTPLLTGTAPAGSVVRIYEGLTLKATGTADSSGLYSIESSTLAQGSHDLTATATTSGGITSETSSITVVLIDTTEPVISNSSSALAASGNTTSPGWVKPGGQYYVYANASDAQSSVWQVTADMDNFTAGQVAAPMTAGTWTVGGVVYGWRTDELTADATLNANSRSYTLAATDAAGNKKVPGATSADVDNTPPAGSLTSPTTGLAGRTTVLESNSSDSDSMGSVTFQFSAAGTASWVTIAIDTSAPYSATWNTTALSSGASYDLRVLTTDSAGNTVASTPVTVVIDHSVPVPPSAPGLATASDTGVVGDDITSAVTPLLTGTATAGTTVRIYDGTTLVGTGTAAGAGTYSISSSALAAGAHALTAVASGTTGSSSEASAVRTITVDSTAPVMVVSDVRIAPVGNLTTAGWVSSNSQYYVYANATDAATGIRTVTANLSGDLGGAAAVNLVAGDYTLAGTSYSYRSAAIAPGSLNTGNKNWSATATDVAGNSTNSGSAVVTVDNNAPSGTITAPLNGWVVASTTVSSNSTDGASGVHSARFDYSPTGAGTWTTITTDTASPYSITWDTTGLVDGTTYDLRVTTTDNAGNTVNSPLVTFTADRTTPTAPSTPTLATASDTGTLGDNITSITTPTLTGTAEAGTTIKIYDAGTLIASGTATGGVWNLAVGPLSAGSHSINATATDGAGHVSQASAVRTITVDSTAPVMVLSDVRIAPVGNLTTAGWVSSNSQYYVYANATDAATGIRTVTANLSGDLGGAAAVNLVAGDYTLAGTSYSYRSAAIAPGSLNTGNKNWSATATDVAGNSTNSGSAVVTVDNNAPSGTITAPLNGWVVASTTVSSNSTDGASGVHSARFDYSPTGAGTWTTITTDTASPYSITWDTTGLVDGTTYDLRVTTTDNAGNTVNSPLVTFTADRTTPTAPSTPTLATASDTGTLGDNITSITTPTLTGTAEAGTTIKIYDAGTLIASGTATGGNWSIALPTQSASTHAITATATDAAGNVSVPTSAVALTIDPSAPSIAIAGVQIAPVGNATTGGWVRQGGSVLRLRERNRRRHGRQHHHSQRLLDHQRLDRRQPDRRQLHARRHDVRLAQCGARGELTAHRRCHVVDRDCQGSGRQHDDDRTEDRHGGQHRPDRIDHGADERMGERIDHAELQLQRRHVLIGRPHCDVRVLPRRHGGVDDDRRRLGEPVLLHLGHRSPRRRIQLQPPRHHNRQRRQHLHVRERHVHGRSRESQRSDDAGSRRRE